MTTKILSVIQDDLYSGASGIFSVGVVCVIGLLSITWLCFQSFPLLYAGMECYTDASNMSNSVNLLLTTAAMVDNLAEKVDECPLNWDLGCEVLFAFIIGTAKTVHYTVSAIQGLLKY